MAVQLGLVLGSVALLVAIMAAVKRLGRAFAWSAEVQRKSVHVATGAYALALPWIFTERWPVLVLAGGTALALLALRLPRLGLGSTLHGVERRSYGDVLFAVAVGIVFFFSIGNPVLYVLPMAVVTLSDAAAALVGIRYGRKHFDVEAGTKSLEGCVMFFLVTWIVAMILLLLMTDIPRANLVLLALVVAAFGALVEADSWRGLDNLFVPVGLQIFLSVHLDTPPLALLGLAAVFLAVLAGVLLLAPRVGLSSHAARAHTVVVFLICAVTAVHNVLLPVAAVLAHLAARHVRPGRSRFPDLDVLAVVVGVALLWLFLGRYADRNALNVYNLSFAGLALVFLVLAAGRRLGLIGLGAAALFGAVMLIAGWNPALAQWHGPLWPWVAASFALCLSVPVWRPGLLDRYRGLGTVVLALPVPLALFALKAWP